MPDCPFCRSPNVSGTTLCRSCGKSLTESTPAADNLAPQIHALLADGKKLEAVKVYKQATGCSLLEAKQAVEDLQFDNSQPARVAATPESLETDVVRLLERGENIAAVRLYRDRQETTLVEAKRAVAAIAAERGVAFSTPGCSVAALLVLLIASLALAMGAWMILRA